MIIPHILVVDDEQDMTRLLKRTLEMEVECRVTMAFSGESALSVLEQESVDLMLCDIRMPGMDGFKVLEYAVRNYPDLTVMMITAFGSIEVAIEAIKNGAYDFVSKPFEQEEILFRVKKALERNRLLKENRALNRENSATFGKLIGTSPAMQRVYDRITMVAQSDVTVLITGESGTGKDLTAQSLHALSPRSSRSFIPVNCPTVPENILESELFGYKKGAFTNAVMDKKGLFQEADGGTIFLDEIGDIGPSIQTKLLRVLQEKEVKPLGDNRTIQVDVRIVASTNRDLMKKIANGEFREDFFYRLNVFTIELPPLRDRITDIPAIASHLIIRHCKNLNREALTLSPSLMEMLMQYNWPGNVRELENVLIQGILHCDSESIMPRDINLGQGNGKWQMGRTLMDNPDFASIGESTESQETVTQADKEKDTEKAMEKAISANESLFMMPYKDAKEKMLREFNHCYVGEMLSRTGGNVSQAARKCHLERQALQQIMKRFDIDADRFR
ncbi:Sigma-54 dependent DNA-binding response regulator (Fis family protein) [Desulfamplus magnetovallimortis]|uniref:Sigma-54 dependent DNA-binding response regulator (Fis family protein) n=1 Tax=Desulfamplus magnetovallimortis TaxID=1246637 RepID=A0A1W1H5A2_9BACT|nr:sigma-54 dependent transcriptional regulator [Desulfamplus magnetovallimortis]SLM27627.1 Sigma-54 dependent DNA-binding response regulator (Fis family protein) [Desulfamplus magnetovallimortis]